MLNNPLQVLSSKPKPDPFSLNPTTNLEPESETGVRQQVNAALHYIFSDAEVEGELCLHIRTTNIVNILTLQGRGVLWRDTMVRWIMCELSNFRLFILGQTVFRVISSI